MIKIQRYYRNIYDMFQLNQLIKFKSHSMNCGASIGYLGECYKRWGLFEQYYKSWGLFGHVLQELGAAWAWKTSTYKIKSQFRSYIDQLSLLLSYLSHTIFDWGDSKCVQNLIKWDIFFNGTIFFSICIQELIKALKILWC